MATTRQKAVRLIGADAVRKLEAASIVLTSLKGAAQKGGRARAASLTPERRQEIAVKAAAARWGAKETA